MIWLPPPGQSLIDEGVVISPLTKYIDFNIRVCRPVGLTEEDCRQVCDYAAERIGLAYDLKNIAKQFENNDFIYKIR